MANDGKKGRPFETIERTYLDIEELRLGPKKTLARHFYHIPNQILPIPPAKRDRAYLGPRDTLGKATKLPRSHFLAALILRNEIQACLGQASDREMLLRNMRKEYAGWSAKQSRMYLERFSQHRQAYNTGTIYRNAVLPPLYAFYWNKNGYIHHPRFPSQYLSFQYCKRQLTSAKFADPRFFTLHELGIIRNAIFDDNPSYTGWHVPALADINTIEAEIQKPLFDAIEFPHGYGKEYNPL